MVAVRRILILELITFWRCFDFAYSQSQAVCSFETLAGKRVFELDETVAVGSQVLAIQYHPANATIASVMISGDLGDYYKNKFDHRVSIDGGNTGSLGIYVNDSLALPMYPSQITRASLRAQVLCSGTQYPIGVIQVKATNRLAPWFYGVPYRVNVSEAAVIGAVIETPILAVDWDPAATYTVTYAITGGNEKGAFVLEQSQGVAVDPRNLDTALSASSSSAWAPSQLPRLVQLRLVKPLDYDYGIRKFVLRISANDNGGTADLDSRTNWTTLVVDVLGTNDLPPVFDSRTYHGVVKKGSPAGAAVSVIPPIHARDGDKDASSPITYHIEKDRWISSYFSIGADSGAITLRDELPSNFTSSELDLIIKAEEADKPSHYATAFIRINILSQNAHYSPEFLHCSMNVSIPEKAVYGTFVARMSAVDFDESPTSQFTYEVVDKVEAEPFYLGSHDGLLTVVKPHLLDRTNKPVYKIKISTLPMLQSRNQSVSLCPVANVNVHLLQGDGAFQFSSPLYKFTAVDATKGSSLIGWVHVINADVSDDASVLIESEEDSDQVRNCTFDIALKQFYNGSAQIVLANLDQIASPVHDLSRTISCIFPLRAQLTVSPEKITTARSKAIINIVNITDSTTLIVGHSSRMQHNVTIFENLPARSSVFYAPTLFNSEANITDYYYFLNDTTGTFAINLTTGWITIANATNVDREIAPRFLLQVARVPSGTLQTEAAADIAELVINLADENDHDPVMVADEQRGRSGTGYFEFKINRTLPVGTIVGRLLARDADENDAGLVRFVTVSSPPYFSLSENGTIALASSLPDKTSIYSIVFQARDQVPEPAKQRYALGMAVIEIADGVARDEQNAPRLSNLPNVVAISESLPVGSAVYDITASIPPSFDQLISIVAGNTNNTFAMSGSSVVVAKPLDAETINLYELRIQLKISGQIRASDTLTIQILDTNENRPIYERPRYEFSMNSSSITPNYIIGTIHAKDADISPPNNEIVYELEGDGFGVFSVDSNTGHIRALAPARRNYSDTYRLSVVARDRGEPSLQDHVVVTIHVLDVPGASPTTPAPPVELPKFTQLQYSAAIAENSSPLNIVQLSAVHPTNQIRYGLDPDSDLFNVDPGSGQVSTTEPLDFELASWHQLRVSACIASNATAPASLVDATNASDRDLCSYATVFVRVFDENDFNPAFDRSEYVALLPKDAVVGSTVVRVHASDNDSDANGDVSYAVKTDTSVFAIDYETGVIRTISANLAVKTYEITVEAFDHGRPSLKGQAKVKVIVNGTDPHAPEFEQFIYHASAPENAGNGTAVIKVKANDPDSGDAGRLSYLLPPSYETTEQEPFQIDPVSGEIRVAGNLDFETRKSYQLMVEAVDHAELVRTGTTLVVISIENTNDNPPIFDPIPDRIFVSSAKEPLSPIFHLRATDRDSPGGGSDAITFSVEPTSQFFDVDKNLLRVKTPLETGEYNITLVARDGGDPPLSSGHPLVVVVMADSQLYPVFPQLSYEFDVKRNASLPETVHTFQAVVKQGVVRYSLIPDTAPGILLDAETGALTITSDLVDNATTDAPVYSIVRATNLEDLHYFSDVSVVITITDHVGPRLPLMFPSALYRGAVSENAPANTYANLTISVIEAETFGDKLTYWLSPNDTFTVDSTGQVFTAQPIDLEALPAAANALLTVQAFASNGSSVVSTIVQVMVTDMDEFEPRFSQPIYNVKISEGIGPGETILKLDATDEDYNDTFLRYAIADSNSSTLVSITSDGLLVKADGPPFDRETSPVVKLVVEAYDQENKKATATLVIELTDTNDVSPQFVGLPYVWNVTEGPEGVGQKFVLAATDADEGVNARVSFRILQGNGEGFFLVSLANGSKAELSVIKPLDREEKAQFLLIIEVRDGGTPSLFSVATVTVNVLNVNDIEPKFFKKQYEQSISADFPLGFPILTIYAQDVDSGSNLTYSLAANTSQSENYSASEYFAIRPESGQITLTKPLPLINHTYEFKAEVSDGLFKDETSISINVEWTKGPVVSVINITVIPPRIPPQFDREAYNFSVAENVENATVGRIGLTGIDNRTLTNATELAIEPDMFRQYFRIDKEGVIYNIRKLSPTSRDLLQPVTYFVSATDKRDPPLKTYVPVSVTILDENDHSPVFSQSEYVGLVPASEKANYTIVLDIRAADDDVGWNAKIRYNLTGADAGCFGIDPDTAMVILTCNPDYYSKNMYNLQVTATDQYGGGNSTTATLTILVVPPVDVATEFPSPPPWTDEHERQTGVAPNGTSSATNANASVPTAGRSVPPSRSSTDNFSVPYSTISTIGPSSITAFDALVSVPGTARSTRISMPSRLTNATSSLTSISSQRVSSASSYSATSLSTSFPFYDSLELSSSATNGAFPSPATFTRSALTEASSFLSSGPSASALVSTPPSGPAPIASPSSTRRSSPFTISSSAETDDSPVTLESSGSPVSLLPVPIGFPSAASVSPSTASSRANASLSTPIPSLSTGPTPRLSPSTASPLPTPFLHPVSTTGPASLATPFSSSLPTPFLPPVSLATPFRPPFSTTGPDFPSISHPATIADHCDSVEFPSEADDIVLSERTPLMTPIYVASAKPPSSTRRLLCYVTYGISGRSADYFDLNKENGLMKVAEALDIGAMTAEGLFDDSKNMLTLNLTASLPDLGFWTWMRLRVRIEPAGEPVAASKGEIRFERRSYSFRVTEQQPAGSFVGEVHAMANETGGSPTYAVLSAADTFKFADPNNGTIVTSAVLNYDGPVKSYSFVIQARDGGKNDYASVTVDVEDVNNFAPAFPKDAYEFQIPEGPYSNGAIVGDVLAVDKDSGVNALINYTIVETDVPFRVESSGRLYAYGEIDREQRDSYSFHVEAEDNGTPPMSSVVTVNVTILDVNDFSPIMDNFTDTVRVPDGTRAPEIVARIHAHDDDAGLNGHVVFRLSGTDSFIVDQDGVIRTVTTLSSQKQKEYVFSVVASDLGRPARSTVRNMTILVEGSPVGPHFTQDAVYQDVPANATVGAPILRMSAGNRSLTYAITGGNENRLFSINPTTGDISLANSPTPGGYTVTVTATNATSGQSASAVARIFVQSAQNGSVSDQQVRAFEQRVYSVDWPENTPGPAELTHMQSVYEKKNQKAKYEIVKGDAGKFRIEADNGVVYVLDRLDRENQSMYIMVIRAKSAARRRRAPEGDFLSNIYQVEYDETILIVNVTDVNDNAQVFTDLPPSGVYTFTVPPGAGVRQMVGRVKAADPDISSVVRYEIIPSSDNDDASAFRIDPDSGQLFTAKNLEYFEKGVFTIIVQATDGLYRSNVTVQIYKAAADKEVTVASGVAPEVLSQYNHTLSKRLSDLTGWTVSVDRVEPMGEEETAEAKGSLLFLSAFDRNRTISVDRDTFIKRLVEVFPTVQNDPKYSLLQLELSKEPARLARTVQTISGPEIALIVISGVVILLALLGVLFLLRWWNKKEKQKVSAEYMLESNAHGKRPYEAETLDPRRRTEAIGRRPEAQPVAIGSSGRSFSHPREGRRPEDPSIGRTHVVVVDSSSVSSDDEASEIEHDRWHTRARIDRR